MAISEDGTQLIVNEGRKYEKYDALPGPAEGCFTDRPGVYGFCNEANRTELTGSCMITYRSLLTGELIQPTIPALRACDLPVGATASESPKPLGALVRWCRTSISGVNVLR